MAEIKLNLSRMNPSQLITSVGRIAGLLAPAVPRSPPIPNMADSLAALNPKLAAAKAANDAYEAARSQLSALKTARDSTAKELRVEAGILTKAAAKESKGEVAMLQAGGFEIAGLAPTPTPVLTAPQNLVLTAGKHDSTVNASCDPPEPRNIIRSYQWQYTTGEPMTGTYVDVEPTSASTTTLTGLTSGQRIWVRVRMVTTHGTTGWSNPASKIVP